MSLNVSLHRVLLEYTTFIQQTPCHAYKFASVMRAFWNCYTVLQEQIKSPLTAFCCGQYFAVLFLKQLYLGSLLKKSTLSQCVPLMKKLKKNRRKRKKKKKNITENERTAFLWNSWNPPVLLVMKVSDNNDHGIIFCLAFFSWGSHHSEWFGG